VRRALLLLLLPFCSACNSTDSATIQIVTGEETDTFTQNPVPTQIQISAVDGSGNVTVLKTAPYPTDSIDLGTQDETAVGALEVAGLDANGNVLIFGSSVEVEYGALSGTTLPIFVQRVGQNARLPGALGDSRQAPVIGVLTSRFLVVAGGLDSTVSESTDVYDFAQFAVLGSPPSLPRAPASMPIVGTAALLIDASGGTYYDFSENAGQDTTPPDTTFGFGDVAGGQSVYDPTDGLVFVVGGTRTTGTPTTAVLEIDTNDTSNASYPTGNLHWMQLSAPRLGASATWVQGRGLVVAGGSATAAGVEILVTGQTPATGAPLAYPADPSSGSGMTWLAGSSVLIAGGVLPSGADAGVRAIDLGCAQSCTPTVWSALPVPLTLASAFTISEAKAFMVGSEVASGLTHTFSLTTTTATEVPTKVPHTNAAAVLSPVGSVVLFGGASEIESFTPGP